MTALTRPGDRTHSACLSLRYTDPCSLCAIHRLQTRQPDHPTSSATASSARTCSAPNPSSRSGFGRSSIGFQHPHRRTCSVSVPSLTLPGNSSACPAVAVSSRQKSTAGTNRAHGKTHSPFCPLRACSDTSLRHFAHAFLDRCVMPHHCHEPRAFTRWGSFSAHSFSKWLKYSSQVSSRRAD